MLKEKVFILIIFAASASSSCPRSDLRVKLEAKGCVQVGNAMCSQWVDIICQNGNPDAVKYSYRLQSVPELMVKQNMQYGIYSVYTLSLNLETPCIYVYEFYLQGVSKFVVSLKTNERKSRF